MPTLPGSRSSSTRGAPDFVSCREIVRTVRGRSVAAGASAPVSPVSVAGMVVDAPLPAVGRAAQPEGVLGPIKSLLPAVPAADLDERDLAWTSVTGVDQRGRWRLRSRGEGR